MNKNNPLQIIEVHQGPPIQEKPPSKRISREEIRACFERKWLQNPEKFNPLRNIKERERIARTMEFIQDHLQLKNLKAVDLGCGYGELTKRLSRAGAIVDAVDVASNALVKIDNLGLQKVKTIQDCLPATFLEDEAYDLVLCTDVIALLEEKNFRLLFSELSRLVKKDGYIVCSTPIDINSDDALPRFANLAQTEFTILDWKFSYHRIYISLKNWLGGGQNRRFLLIMEQLSKVLYGDAGISHAIFIAKRRPLAHLTDLSEPFIWQN